MDRSHRHFHRRALAVVLATLLVPLVVGSAMAAPGDRPAVTVTAGTPSGTSVSVTADVNRGTNALDWCRYVIDDSAAVPCPTSPDATAKKVSRYTIALSNQSAGDHTITVTVRLGDGGKATGSDSFTIVGHAHAFAVAWTDKNDNHTYESATDSLIAEVVDTNDDGIVSIGDTVIADRYPLTVHASGFGTFGLTSETVTGVQDIGIGVSVNIPSGFISWQHIATAEGVLFGLGGGSTNPVLLDGTNPDLDCVGDSSDAVVLHVGGTLHPDTAADDVACDDADNAFVDVAFD